MSGAPFDLGTDDFIDMPPGLTLVQLIHAKLPV